MTIALRTKQIPTWVWSVSGVLLGLLVLWIALGNLIANGRVQPIESAQASLLKQFPDRDNDSARQISAQWKKLKLTPAADQKVTQTENPNLQAVLETYIHAQVAATDNKSIQPPEELKQFFEGHGEAIGALRQLILDGDAPVWGVNIKTIAQDPARIPTQSWLVHLNRVLLYDALRKNRNDYYQGSFDSVMAARKLTQFLSDRPDLASHQLLMTLAEEQAGVFRHLRYMPPDWEIVIPERSHKGVLRALQTENWVVTKTTINHVNGKGQKSAVFNTVTTWITRPYALLPLVNHWQQQDALLQSLLAEDVCQKSAGKDSIKVWQRSGFQDLRWELTRKVQQVRTVLERSGKLPETMKGIETSMVCPGLKWKYQATNSKGEVAIVNPPAWLKALEQKHGKTEYHFKIE
jgi:hypothetical protein